MNFTRYWLPRSEIDKITPENNRVGIKVGVYTDGYEITGDRFVPMYEKLPYTLTYDGWWDESSLAPKIPMYKKVLAEMEAMVAAIEASSLKGVEITVEGKTFAALETVSNSLKELYAPAGHQVANPPVNLTEFNWIQGHDTRFDKPFIDIGNNSTKLYEAYFGYVPAPGDFSNGDPTYTEFGGGGNSIPVDDDKPTTGGSRPGIMIQDGIGVVVDNDMPLIVPLKNKDGSDITNVNGTPNTLGRKVIATITGAPAGYNYLKWTISDGGAASLSVVTPGQPEPSSTCPTIKPLRVGTATVSVINCNSAGANGNLKASFTVNVVEFIEVEEFIDE
jgi:hypothetical protein